MDWSTIEGRALHALRVLRTAGQWVWSRPWAFLAAVTAMNLFFARETFSPGIWADNDSVCHYAYLRHLVEEFYPATGTFMGFTPKYNLGLPYLVYNTPPGVYVLSALVCGATGLSPLASLKAVVVTSFLSVPLLGYALARTFEEEKTDLPKYTALALSLFSSELFGVEFYFKNGMLNPALAVPMLMGALIAYRRAQITTLPKSFAWIALGGCMFALTVFTHVLSAYMLCIGLLAFTVGAGFGDLGKNVFKLGVMLTTGGLLVAEWLYPSLKFAAPKDAAYTWSRDWTDTLSDFFDGSLFSSYPVGFFPNFIVRSNVAVIATIAGLFAFVLVLRRYNRGVGSVGIMFLLAMTIALGPTIHFGVSILPLYDRLLWYRFITLAALSWFMFAAYGAYRFGDAKFRYYPLNVIILGAVGVWAFMVMTTRAVKVSTAASQPQFEKSTDDIATWLRDHGDKRGRVFSEFLGQGVVQAISVNYPRHMIPILSGFDEAGGWIYENNPVSQSLMKKGPFWFNPVPMMEAAPHYNVKYIVAGSPQFIHVLSGDPRWSSVLETPDLVLFERVNYTPAFAEADGVTTTIADKHFVRGGGYAYALDIEPKEPLAGDTSLLVKTNYAPAWKATMNGAPLAIESTDDGMISVRLPKGTNGKARVDLVWSIDDLRAKGRKGTLAGVALVLVLLAASRLKRSPFSFVSERATRLVGSGAFLLALAAFAWRSRNVDLQTIGGFGVAGGMSRTFDPASLSVGSYNDEQATLPVHLVTGAWSDRQVSKSGDPIRHLVSQTTASLSVVFGTNSMLRIDGVTSTGALDARVTMSEEGTHRTTCVLNARLGEDVAVPADCLSGARRAGQLGIRRELSIETTGALDVSRIGVKSGIVYVEAESLVNTVYDGGCEAFYSAGAAVEYYPQNGSLMIANPPYHCPVDLLGNVDLRPGPYDIWVLMQTFHPRFRMTRGDLSLDIAGTTLGPFDGVTRQPMQFWDRDTRFEWVELGSATLRDHEAITVHLRRRLNAVAGLFDVDALAFEPR